jgi:DNA helicase-2/ATP-dependent DNA helicase PcrA
LLGSDEITDEDESLGRSMYTEKQVLNEKQLLAVNSTEGYVRVIAGAGTGKTKLLVNRYAHLVQEYGIDSANILCVTFTNKAAGEMRSRVRALIGDGYDTSLICTYHGFCARILRDNPEKLFLSKGFQIIDTYQQKAILEDLYQKHELKLDHASFGSILKKIGEIKRDLNYVPLLCSPEKKQILPSIRSMDDRIIEEFLQRQKAVYSLDFHDLINFAIYLLRTDPQIREMWQDRLNYIMVDEFQDSSGKEMELVDLLSGKYKNLMIVGDPDQNIYEWRGSDVKLLVDFDKSHESTKTVFLEQNYRSTPEILTCANTLISKNELRIKKNLYTRSSHGKPVCHCHFKSDLEEADAIVAEIKEAVKQKHRYSDIAILYRSGFLSRVVEKQLVENNIPYEIFGGVKFYQRMEVLDIIAYLRLIAFDDDLAFKRIINSPRRRFGRVKMNHLETIRNKESGSGDGSVKSLFDCLKEHISEEIFKTSSAKSFISFITDARKTAEERTVAETVNYVMTESGYEKYIRELGDEERLDNLAEFKRLANEYERNYGEEITLPEFLQQIALLSNEGDEKDADTVKLMTIHSAKGLEFPIVFLIGLSEGIFPSSKTIEERRSAGLEEERRLCYVAITRAKEQLFLTDSEGFSAQGNNKLPSRFLEEIGEQNYIRKGKISAELKKELHSLIASNEAMSKRIEKEIGDEVEHHIFGKGRIAGKDDKHGSYIVKFENMALPRNITKSYFDRYVDPVNNIARSGNDLAESEGAQSDLSAPDDKSLMVLDTEFEAGNDDDPGIPASSKDSRDLNDSEVREKLKNTGDLWKRDDVPHSGWKCTGVTDLGAPVGVCEMCGHQIIRYVHHMVHPDYGPLDVGCVCAGKMEGDIQAAKKREAEYKHWKKLTRNRSRHL